MDSLTRLAACGLASRNRRDCVQYFLALVCFHRIEGLLRVAGGLLCF